MRQPIPSRRGVAEGRGVSHHKPSILRSVSHCQAATGWGVSHHQTATGRGVSHHQTATGRGVSHHQTATAGMYRTVKPMPNDFFRRPFGALFFLSCICRGCASLHPCLWSIAPSGLDAVQHSDGCQSKAPKGRQILGRGGAERNPCIENVPFHKPRRGDGWHCNESFLSPRRGLSTIFFSPSHNKIIKV